MTAASPRRGRLAWVLVWLALANLLGYGARNVLAPAFDDLHRQLAVDDADFGLLASAFMAPHALATLVMGWLGDRVDRRRLIGGGLLLAAVAGLAGALASGVTSLMLARAAAGVGTATIVPVANSILGELFDGPRKASALSIFNLGLFLGGVVGFAAGDNLEFRWALVVLAAPAVVVAAVVAWLPVAPRRGGAAGDAARASVGQAARALLARRSFRWILGSTTAMAFASGAYLTWFKEFLVRGKGMSDGQASALFAVCILGGLGGVLTGGRVADVLRRRGPAGRLWAIVVGMGITVPVAAACIVTPVGVPLYVLAVLTMYFISWYHAPMAASVDDLAPAGGEASAQAFVIFLMHLCGTAPASWLVGRLIGAAGFEVAMLVPTGMVGVAAVLMALATRHFAADRLAAGKG